ncbi:hypothetical protein HK102_005529, partial [Quaeritorhiza haematococci]
MFSKNPVAEHVLSTKASIKKHGLSAVIPPSTWDSPTTPPSTRPTPTLTAAKAEVEAEVEESGSESLEARLRALGRC